VLRAVQVIVDEKLARPILVGRPEVLLARIEKFGLRLRLGEDVEVTNPEYDERFHQYWTSYWELMCRSGVTKEMARVEMRRRLTLIGAMMVRLGDADGMICGTVGGYQDHLRFIDQDRQEARLGHLRRHEHPAAGQADRGAGGHPRQRQPHGRADCRIHHRRRRGNDAAAHEAQGPAVALQLRLWQLRLRQQDAPGAGTDPPARTGLEVDGEMHGDCALDEACAWTSCRCHA
jgi:malate dehydrogenase (oxaloacetate-decarboxylating)(NADP+)